MSERDFVFWLKGFIVAKESLDNNDLRFIEVKIDEIFREERQRTEDTYKDIISRVGAGL